MTLKPLKVEITGDTTKLEAAMGRVGGIVKGAAVGIGAAAGLVTGAFAAMTVQGLRAVDTNAKLARALDGTANGLRAVQIAAGYAGVSAGGLQAGLETMNRELAKAADAGSPVAKTLQAIGLSADELRKMDIDKRVETIADRLKGMGADASTTALVLQRLGVRGREMVDFFRQGGDSIRAAREEVRGFGLELSEVQTNAVEAANDAVDRMGLVFDGLRQKLAVEIAPTLQAVADRFNELARSARVQEIIEKLAASFGGLAEVILSEDFIGAAASGLESLAGLATMLADGMVTLSQNVEIVTVSMGALAVAAAAAGGPIWLVAGALAAALVGINKWRGAANETKGSTEALKQAQDALNVAMGGYNSAAPTSRREAHGLATAYVRQAEAALAAAEAELTLMKAEAARFANAPMEERGLLGDAVDENNVADVEAATAAVNELTTALDGARRTLAGVSRGGGLTVGDPPSTPPGDGDTGGGLEIPGLGGGGGGVADTLASRLEALTQGLQTEAETVKAWYDESLQTLIDAKEAQILTEEEYRALREKLEQEHQDRMRGIQGQGDNSRLAALKGALGDAASAMQSGSEKMFKIGKAASLASAVISGWEAATEAWAKGMKIGGPPVAAAFTAASLIRTGAMISNIAKQNMNGGGAGASRGGSSSAGSMGSQPAPMPTQTFIIDAPGINLESFVNTANEAIKRGYRIDFRTA